MFRKTPICIEYRNQDQFLNLSRGHGYDKTRLIKVTIIHQVRENELASSDSDIIREKKINSRLFWDTTDTTSEHDIVL